MELIKFFRQIENWNGPVSLAVAFDLRFFDEDLLPCYYKFFEKLKRSSTKAEKYLSVHYLIQNEKDRCEKLNDTVVSGFKKECTNFFQKLYKMRGKLQFLSQSERIKKMTSYEINASRNFAKILARTKFIIIGDLDHLFSSKFEEKMRNFTKDHFEENPKSLLVYRIFEIQRDSKDPKDKSELRSLLSSDKAREFHVKNRNQSVIERLDEWLQYPDDDVTVQFTKNYSNLSWEPQFVSNRNIPDFDERFRYPMKDNTVLVIS